MIYWEGGTFLLLSFILTAAFIFHYLKNMRRARALQRFFAGLAHELKTPLSSVKLQGELLLERGKGHPPGAFDQTPL